MTAVIDFKEATAMINCVLSSKLPMAISAIELIEEREEGKARPNRLNILPEVRIRGSLMRQKMQAFNNKKRTWWLKITHLSDNELDYLVASGYFDRLQGIIHLIFNC